MNKEQTISIMAAIIFSKLMNDETFSRKYDLDDAVFKAAQAAEMIYNQVMP